MVDAEHVAFRISQHRLMRVVVRGERRLDDAATQRDSPRDQRVYVRDARCLKREIGGDRRFIVARAAAAQFQQQMGQPGQNPGGAPTQNMPPDPNAQPQVSGGGELMDETLPTAGGGGQQMAAE
jgi:hypothetical protein